MGMVLLQACTMHKALNKALYKHHHSYEVDTIFLLHREEKKRRPREVQQLAKSIQVDRSRTRVCSQN